MLYFILWYLSGLLMYPIEFGWSYQLGKIYSILGSPDEQWFANGRKWAVKHILSFSLYGPFAFLVSVILWFDDKPTLKFTFGQGER